MIYEFAGVLWNDDGTLYSGDDIDIMEGEAIIKYIRTKEWIWEIMEIRPDYEKVYYHCKHNLIGKRFEKEEILKTADTIEELCDLYVVWLKNRELPITERPQKGVKLFPSYFELGECSFDKGYGAIWTESGLKYVARMNDKGDLELL